MIGGATLIASCATPRPPVAAGDKPQALTADETYVCVSATLLQAAGYAGLRFYFAGLVQETQPSTSIGPTTLQFTVNPLGKTGTSTGALLYKAKLGWLRLGGVDVMSKSATFKLAAKLVPNAVNYVGDVVVDAGLYDINVSVRASQQTLDQLRTKFGEIVARYPVTQRILV